MWMSPSPREVVEGGSGGGVETQKFGFFLLQPLQIDAVKLAHFLKSGH